jgi:hexosaminidase
MALYEAPLQMLADSPTKYEKNMECFSFMVKTPVVWDETVGLGGTPESYAAVARKGKDGTWYAAAISNRDARDIEIDTSFLGKGEWEAEIFRDANDADKQPTHYVHDFKYVKAGEQLKFHVAPGGGFVIAFKVAEPVLALVPMPREITLTKGSCPAAAKPKVEKVAGIAKEGYELSVTPKGVTIRASGDAGVFYAQQTLAQLADATSASLPCCEIKDSPRFMWRGVHMDDVRHFMGKDTVKRLIDEIAKYKFNVFHWHLTDDQAWRLEMPEYPELTAKLGSDFYTAADVKEVLAYAAERHVTVVPEVEFPGHFRGVRLAYKDFSCRDAPYPYPMCVGNSNAVIFAEKALDRVCDLFTSKVIHFGGDECKRGGWEKCPRCQELIKREGLSGVEAIQPWLTRRLTAHLEAKGRHAIGWDEIFDDAGDTLPKGTMGMCWRREGIGAGAANKGYKIVRCPTSHCYFDYSQGLEGDTHDYFMRTSGWKSTIDKVYSFDPLEGVAPEARGNIVGGQCCNWTEKTFNREDLEFKLWPRALALAEVLWTYPEPGKRNFAEFKRRAIVRRDEMAARGMNVAPLK